jgi:predicted GTPase
VVRLVLDAGQTPALVRHPMPYRDLDRMRVQRFAARQAGAAVRVDPRPHAFGSIATTYRQYPKIGSVLPAMGYGKAQLDDLSATVLAAVRASSAVVVGTPMDLARSPNSAPWCVGRPMSWPRSGRRSWPTSWPRISPGGLRRREPSRVRPVF